MDNKHKLLTSIAILLFLITVFTNMYWYQKHQYLVKQNILNSNLVNEKDRQLETENIENEALKTLLTTQNDITATLSAQVSTLSGELDKMKQELNIKSNQVSNLQKSKSKKDILLSQTKRDEKQYQKLLEEARAEVEKTK